MEATSSGMQLTWQTSEFSAEKVCFLGVPVCWDLQICLSHLVASILGAVTSCHSLQHHAPYLLAILTVEIQLLQVLPSQHLHSLIRPSSLNFISSSTVLLQRFTTKLAIRHTWLTLFFFKDVFQIEQQKKGLTGHEDAVIVKDMGAVSGYLIFLVVKVDDTD